MIKATRREGCKFFRCLLLGLALAALAVDIAAAGRAALVPDINVAVGRAREVMRTAADKHEFFAYSSAGGLTIAPVSPADPIDAASARRLSMEVEMKTGHQKAKKKDTQLNSPAGAEPAIMFPRKSDEDSQMREPKPAKEYRRPTPPKSEESR